MVLISATRRAAAFTLIRKSILLADWAAGEGLVPEADGIEEPGEFVYEAILAFDLKVETGDPATQLVDAVIAALGAPPAEDLVARVAELEAWKQHIMTHADQKKRPFHDRLAQEVLESQAKTITKLNARLAGLPGHLAEAKARIAELEAEAASRG